MFQDDIMELSYLVLIQKVHLSTWQEKDSPPWT